MFKDNLERRENLILQLSQAFTGNKSETETDDDTTSMYDVIDDDYVVDMSKHTEKSKEDKPEKKDKLYMNGFAFREPRFPDLEKIKYLFANNKRISEFLKSKGVTSPDIAFTIFPQLWENTGTGISLIGGDTLTEEYTVILHERQTVLYAVFFGNQLAYAIEKPNDIFLQNLSGRYVNGKWDAGAYGRDILRQY